MEPLNVKRETLGVGILGSSGLRIICHKREKEPHTNPPLPEAHANNEGANFQGTTRRALQPCYQYSVSRSYDRRELELAEIPTLGLDVVASAGTIG